MKTLYIDIYFLINFTIDMLALYFSLIFLSIPSGLARIITTSLLGALFASALIFLPQSAIIESTFLVLLLLSVAFVAAKGVSLSRRIKLTAAFLVFEMLIAGGVQLLYNTLDKYLSSFIKEGLSEVNNRRLILLAITVLFVIVILKLILKVFESRLYGGCAEVELAFLGRNITIDSLCDTGNLVKDPMDNSAVFFVKKSILKPLFPEIEDKAFEALPSEKLAALPDVKRRIRMIPVNKGGKTKLYIGIKPDSINIKSKNGNEGANLTVAIDDEGGTYGGHFGLLPSAAIGDAFR